MTLNRWDPVRELLNIQDRMNRIVHCGCEEALFKRPACWCPVVDVLETPDSYIFRAELPGVGRENINIEVSVNKLRIFGERPIEPEPQIAAYHSCERVHGHFDRKFAIPGIIDTEGAAAKYEDGILEIRLPKAREERNHHIHVVCLG